MTYALSPFICGACRDDRHAICRGAEHACECPHVRIPTPAPTPAVSPAPQAAGVGGEAGPGGVGEVALVPGSPFPRRRRPAAYFRPGPASSLVPRPAWWGDGICSIEGCTRTVHRRQLCRPHYDEAPRVIRVPPRPPNPICSLESCEEIVHAGGMCSTHYWRNRLHGDPYAVVGFRNAPALDRFWAKVNKNGPVPSHRQYLGPCWVWTGALTTGYGRFIAQAQRSRRRIWVPAHRWLYEQSVGPVSPDLDLDHLCRNRACVRPTHLEPVTRQVNLQRGIDDRRAGIL